MTCRKHFPHHSFTAVVNIPCSRGRSLFYIVLISHKYTFLCVCAHIECATVCKWRSVDNFQVSVLALKGRVFHFCWCESPLSPISLRNAGITHLTFVIWDPGIKFECTASTLPTGPFHQLTNSLLTHFFIYAKSWWYKVWWHISIIMSLRRLSLCEFEGKLSYRVRPCFIIVITKWLINQRAPLIAL